jgi:dynein heavy chain
MAESFKELYLKYVPVCIDRIFEGSVTGEDVIPPLQLITPRTNLNLVRQLCDLIDSMLPAPDAQPPPPEEVDQLERLYIFCLIWSLGGTLVQKDRDIFS